VRDFSGKEMLHDPYKYQSKLIGFDSIKNSENIIVDKLDGYRKPLLTPDRQQVENSHSSMIQHF
jgi:hypothetical protein